MSRIAHAFAACRAEGRAALVGYLTAFDPDRTDSRERIFRACEAGLDVLELGVPFSDPNADGPEVQAAMVRALAAGADLAGTLALARDVRERFALPIVLFSYANPLLRRAATLAGDAIDVGLDGVLVIDLPPEHAAVLRTPLVARDLDWIGLVAPTSTPERMRRVAAITTGFVYAVTLRGVTGAKVDVEHPELVQQLAALRGATQLPIAAGFGVRTPEQARVLGRHADGVVVGSALIRAAQQGGTRALVDLVAALRASLVGTSA